VTASGGLNPYDSAVTGSYPYPGQAFPSRPAPASGNPQDATEGRYYRPAPDGYPANGSDQARPGYGPGYGNGNGQAAPSDGRY
jgi:hypothetical protein